MARSPETTDANNVVALFDEPLAEEVGSAAISRQRNPRRLRLATARRST
jgi:hypothetical protein